MGLEENVLIREVSEIIQVATCACIALGPSKVSTRLKRCPDFRVSTLVRIISTHISNSYICVGYLTIFASHGVTSLVDMHYVKYTHSHLVYRNQFHLTQQHTVAIVLNNINVCCSCRSNDNSVWSIIIKMNAHNVL